MRSTFAIIALAGAAAIPLVQGSRAEATFTRISDVRNVWYGDTPATSPDGRFILVASDSGGVRFDRQTRQWAPFGAELWGFYSFSPNGRFLAQNRRNSDGQWYVEVIPVDPATGTASGTPRRVSTEAGARPTWSPDSRSIAFVQWEGNRGRVLVVPFNGGEARKIVDRAGTITCPRWTADGRSLICQMDDPQFIGRVSVATGAIDTIRKNSPHGALSQVSLDGSLVSQIQALYRTVTISSTADGRVVSSVVLPRAMPQPSWSGNANDKLIAIEHVVPTHVHAVDLASGAVREALPSSATADRFDQGAAYSPDGARLAFETRVGDRYRVAIAGADGSSPRIIAGDASAEGKLLWSPSGRHLVYATAEPIRLHVIDVASGTDRAISGIGVPSDTVEIEDFTWRADGAALRYVRRFRSAPGRPIARAIHDVTIDGHDTRVTAIADSMAGPLRFLTDSILPMPIGPVPQYTNDKPATGLRVLSLPSGQWKTVYSGSVRNLGPAFGISADRKWIAMVEPGTNGQSIRLVSLTGNETRRVNNPLGGEISQVHILPGSDNLLVSVCTPCRNERWDGALLPINGDPPRVLTARDPHFLDGDDFSLSRDGRTIIYTAEAAYRSALMEITLPRAK